MKNKSIFRVALVSILVSAACSSMAQENETVKIGFITDLSGAYSDLDGPGGADAIRMAAEDYGGNALGRPIEILTADHQN
jgi:branched-chain amino acid transport system substrate-binding protein